MGVTGQSIEELLEEKRFEKAEDIPESYTILFDGKNLYSKLKAIERSLPDYNSPFASPNKKTFE